MIRGFYTSAAGALVAEAMIDNVSNNLANVVDQRLQAHVAADRIAAVSTQLYRFQTDPGQNAGQPLARRSCARRRSAARFGFGRLRDADELRARPDRDQRQHALVRAFRPRLLRDSRSDDGPVTLHARRLVPAQRRRHCSRRVDGNDRSRRRRPHDPDAGARQDRSRHRRATSTSTARRRARRSASFEFNNVQRAAAARRNQLHRRRQAPASDRRRRPASFSTPKKRATATSCGRSSISSPPSVGSTPTKRVIQTQDDATNQAIATVGHRRAKGALTPP